MSVCVSKESKEIAAVEQSLIAQESFQESSQEWVLDLHEGYDIELSRVLGLWLPRGLPRGLILE